MDVPAPPPRPLAAFLRRYRVLAYCLIGLVCLDGLVAVRRQTWVQYDPDDYAARVQNCRRRARDLIVIGGSPVSEGVDPVYLDSLCWQERSLKNAYNLGLPGGTMTDFWHALEHGAVRPPRLLIYGITASDLNDNRQEPHGARVLLDAHDLAGWMRAKPHTAFWAVKHFTRGRLANAWQLYRYRNGIRLWAAESADMLWPGSFSEAAAEAQANRDYASDMGRADGFAPNRNFRPRRLDLMKAAGWRCEQFHFLDGYRLGEHVRYLDRLLDWADSNHVSLVLVDMPVSADLETGQYAPAFAAYRKLLSEIEQRRNVNVIRANSSAAGLGDEHFADLIHLNAAGTQRFSDWVRSQLNTLSSVVAADRR